MLSVHHLHIPRAPLTFPDQGILLKTNHYHKCTTVSNLFRDMVSCIRGRITKHRDTDREYYIVLELGETRWHIYNYGPVWSMNPQVHKLVHAGVVQQTALWIISPVIDLIWFVWKRIIVHILKGKKTQHQNEQSLASRTSSAFTQICFMSCSDTSYVNSVLRQLGDLYQNESGGSLFWWVCLLENQL